MLRIKYIVFITKATNTQRDTLLKTSGSKKTTTKILTKKNNNQIFNKLAKLLFEDVKFFNDIQCSIIRHFSLEDWKRKVINS